MNKECKSISNFQVCEIATTKGLSGTKLKDFLQFMNKRFPDEKSNSYIAEWAGRFSRGTEWDYSDGESRKVLSQVNPQAYNKGQKGCGCNARK